MFFKKYRQKSNTGKERKALPKLSLSPVGALWQAALSASSEEEAAEAVFSLGQKSGRDSLDALKAIRDADSPLRVRGIARLLVMLRTQEHTYEWFNKNISGILKEIRENRLETQDLARTFLNAQNSSDQLFLLRALLLDGQPMTSSVEDSFHVILRDLLEKADKDTAVVQVRSFNQQYPGYMPDEITRRDQYQKKIETQCQNARYALAFLLEDLPEERAESFDLKECSALKSIFGREPQADPRTEIWNDPTLNVYIPVNPGVFRTLVSLWSRSGDSTSRWLVKLRPLLDTVRSGNPDVRSSAASKVAEEAGKAMETLGMTVADIPDEVLLAAQRYGIPLPLNYLYENGKKELIAGNFPRRSVRYEKHFDPEDDRFYEDEVYTVWYGDPNDDSGWTMTV